MNTITVIRDGLYPTLADACAYVEAQHPTQDDRWTILIESVVRHTAAIMPSYTTICGAHRVPLPGCPETPH